MVGKSISGPEHFRTKTHYKGDNRSQTSVCISETIDAVICISESNLQSPVYTIKIRGTLYQARAVLEDGPSKALSISYSAWVKIKIGSGQSSLKVLPFSLCDLIEFVPTLKNAALKKFRT